MLIATGLCIHRPSFFSFISFHTVVRIHNVLGFIMLAAGSWAFMMMVFASGYLLAYPLRSLWLGALEKD